MSKYTVRDNCLMNTDITHLPLDYLYSEVLCVYMYHISYHISYTIGVGLVSSENHCGKLMCFCCTNLSDTDVFVL